MALRFNPPPNWPAPPEGFEPPAGWQPDPAWGPAPEGWQIWVDDSAASSASAASAAGAAAEADPAWAPTQAVSTAPTASLSTASPVADPTGMSASAPSGDYAGAPATAGGSPYAANMDYAQSPTPFQPQGAAGGMQPPTGGWQPNAAAPAGPGNGSKPLTQQWWFWTGIAAVVVVALVIGGIFMFKGDSSDSDTKADSTSSSEPTHQKKSDPDSKKKTSDPDETDSPAPKKTTKTSSPNNNGPGSSEKDPIDPKAGAITLNAGKYDDDPNASVDVTFGDVEWNANESVKAATSQYSYKEPPAGKVYIRVPVEITYHGQGQFDEYDLKIGFTHDGNTAESEYLVGGQSLFSRQSMPRDGGKAKGDFIFLVDESAANEKKGAFAVSAFSQVDNKNEVYVAAK
ncbi:hypothetical protein BKH20_03065 [Actinomyces oris]|uniref:DUF4352 domain-containing protein n=1 Tax=Actinomyces oris TaxID=544580 RepID=A0A1Q8WVI9_9ACTO|nr:hypothetical protein [Actinomyces oris]OLO72054.1 hypothetical protein BKH20_03065 [Actinomyces oris]